MCDSDDLTESIDDLIDATGATETLFHAAAGHVRSEKARFLLLARAQRFGRAAAALRALAGARGTVPVASSRVVGATRIPSADDAGVLADCERLETAGIVAYRDALERALPATERAVIAREFECPLASPGMLGAARERAARQQRQVLGPPV